ncbi:hypothetical protein K443DRAFT_615580 [Laccaria amethystina LaAM-08-1]|uniref:Uncharacterized protein n=1 Tax=Laccaria amethystina LaAM-08-1 TaxID=1095629 RepID=A0A0C9XEZ1_9AGAR|nr:hypothetical protein K443DRAFT_615580 [Laccaria amethystina LaAM-08-1]
MQLTIIRFTYHCRLASRRSRREGPLARLPPPSSPANLNRHQPLEQYPGQFWDRRLENLISETSRTTGLLVTPNEASPWFALTSSAAHHILEFLGINVMRNTI